MKKLFGMLLLGTVTSFGQFGRPGYLETTVPMPEPSALLEIGVAVGALSILAVRWRHKK
jgi:hypothetical protein